MCSALLGRADRLRPYRTVKRRGNKERAFSLGLRHGGAPLLYSVGSECWQDIALQRLQTGSLIKGSKLRKHFHLCQPSLAQPSVEAGLITAQLVTPITRPAWGFQSGLQLGGEWQV